MATFPDVRVFPDADALARAAADLFADAARDAIAARGRFTVALSGGSTPEKLYRLLAAPPYHDSVDWARIVVFLGDERFVPANDERSNYGLAERTLLRNVGVLAENVYPVDTSLPTAEAAARAYADTLARVLGGGGAAGDAPPVFDLVLLGLGDDGHTASLFPGKPALTVTDAWAVASPPGVLPPPVERVTLTFPVLNAARRAVFLAAGEKKAAVVREVLAGTPSVADAPAVGVRPTAGDLVWLLDEAAASARD